MIQIALGVLLLNENKLTEMSQIIGEYMKLVPTCPSTGQHELPNNSVLEFLFGGDYLTVARIRGAQVLHSTEDKAVECLKGVIPVNEDWHSRMTLLKVS